MSLKHIIVVFLGCIVPMMFASSAEKPTKLQEGDGAVRNGEFDPSTEELALQFRNLKRGMTPSQVRAIFPQHVRWQLLDINRHYKQESGFQWQTKVFFVFVFANKHPVVGGQVNIPDDLSSDWSLESAFVKKKKVAVVDGREVVRRSWPTPSIYYDLLYRVENAK